MVLSPLDGDSRLVGFGSCLAMEVGKCALRSKAARYLGM
jgi:hypothetical protein